jgi:hypothetical protein
MRRNGAYIVEFAEKISGVLNVGSSGFDYWL